MNAGKYIDDEFETMRSKAIKGERNPAIEAVMKMCFISGMSAALGYRGNDWDLRDALVPALEAIQEQFGGRTLFPIHFDPKIDTGGNDGSGSV